MRVLQLLVSIEKALIQGKEESANLIRSVFAGEWIMARSRPSVSVNSRVMFIFIMRVMQRTVLLSQFHPSVCQTRVF